MNDKSRHEGAKPEAATPSGPRSAGSLRLDRRALLRAGAKSAPVLLTLASAPVAATNSCVVASSFVSVATFKSRNPTTTVVKCTTRTCEDWRTACTQQPRPAILDVKVKDSLGSTSSSYNNNKLFEVLQSGSGIATTGELGVLQHIISLRCSIVGGFVTAPGNVTAAYLSTVWANYKTNGNQYKLPASGIQWDSAKLISWLRYLLYPITV